MMTSLVVVDRVLLPLGSSRCRLPERWEEEGSVEAELRLSRPPMGAISWEKMSC